MKPSTIYVPNIGQEPAASAFAPESLSPIELRAVHTLIAYAAWKEGNSEEKICEFMLTAFGVTSLQTMPSSRYDDILHYLLNPPPCAGKEEEP